MFMLKGKASQRFGAMHQKEFTQTNHTIFCNVMYAYVCKICEEK